MGLIALGLFMWTVIAVSIVAAWIVARRQAERTASKCCRQELQPFDNWREVFVEFLAQYDNDKTGE